MPRPNRNLSLTPTAFALLLSSGATALTVALCASNAAAATIPVTTTNMTVNGSDGCAFMEALEALNTRAAFSDCPAGNGSADTITLKPDIGIYSLPATRLYTLEIERSVIIRSATAGVQASIKSNNDTRELFFISSNSLAPTGVNVEFRDIVLQGPSPGSETGIYAFGPGNRKLTLLRCRITQFGGSAVIVQGMDLDIIDSIIDFNTSTNGGGVFFAPMTTDTAAVLNVRFSEISNNAASGVGGGIYFGDGGASTIVNSTIASNSASSGGGLELFLPGTGTFSITGSTIGLNSASGQGGGVRVTGAGKAILAESIVGSNSASPAPDWHGSIWTCNNSLVQSTQNTNVLGGTNNLFGQDPGFLNDRTWDVGGAYHTGVLALGSDSPAIDFNATSGQTEDQRHFPRGVDAIADGNRFDIGACEHDANMQTELMIVSSKSSDVHATSVAPQFSNGKGSNLQSNAVGDFVSYYVPITRDDCSSISVGVMRTSTSAKVQLMFNRPAFDNNSWSPIGPVLDLWARDPVFKELAVATKVKIFRNTTRFRFDVVGRNNANRDGYQIFPDYIKIAAPTSSGPCMSICPTPPCAKFSD